MAFKVSDLTQGLSPEDVAAATNLYSNGQAVHSQDPNADVVGRAKLIQQDRLKQEANNAAVKAQADQVARDAAAKAATAAQGTANTQAATSQLNTVASGSPEALNYVHSLVPQANIGYQPPQSNYAPQAPAFDQAAAAKQIGKIQYGAFGMTNQQVDELNLKLQGQANPNQQQLTTNMGTDIEGRVANPNYRPAPAPAGAPPGAGDAKPVGAPAPAPAPAPAQPATTYTQPVQPQAPAPATPAAKLTQTQPAQVPSLQDLAHGLLAKMQSRPR